MPYSENDLHEHIELVKDGKQLTVTELDCLLRERLTLDKEDKTILQGRSDDKFSQIVRNIVSHATSDVFSKNGYTVKTVTPAIIRA